MHYKFYRFFAPILCFCIILASITFVHAQSFSDTPIILVIDYSSNNWESYSTTQVELSDVVLPNGQWRSIRLREIQIPITEGNVNSIVNIDFAFAGALIAAAGETHNVGYTKTGGDFSNYYTTASYGSKRYVKNFTDSRIFFDYVFPQNISTIRQFYFSPLAYHVIASVYISGSVGQTFSLTCSNPPTFTFWENQTSNIIPSYWVFRGFSSVLPDYDGLFGTIMQTIEFFRDSYVDISTQLLNKLDGFNINFIATQIQRQADLTAELVEIESEHQDMIDDWLDTGAGNALDNGKTSIEDSDGFGLLDDFSSGISSGPQFNYNNFENIWKSGGQSRRWFSSTCEDALHDPGLDTRGNNISVIDFIHPHIEEINEALGVDYDD